MRKIFIILIPLLPFIVKAQLLNTVDQIATYNNPYSQLVFVKDSLRGGQFLPYSGTDAVDNGIIFSDALSRKWKRQLGADNVVSVGWYGLTTTASISSSTNYNAFMSAYNYVIKHSSCDGLIIPSGTFNINETITIDTSISIKGIGSYLNIKSVFVFPYGITGIIGRTLENEPNTVLKISNFHIRTDANLYNPQDYQPIDSSKHGFDLSCVFIFNNVASTNWGGDAFHINACARPGYPNFGNSDNSEMTYCNGSISNNGVYFDGCDANIITVHNNDFSLNRRYGIQDKGMLGNDYLKNHMAYNGVYKTFCTSLYNGVYYAAINEDSVININKRPDLNSLYWSVINFVPYTVNAWSDTVKYWSGGTARRQDTNNYSLILGEYTEGSQPPTRNKGRALTIGGDNGSGVSEGAWIYADDNRLWIKNVGLVTENLATTGSVTFHGYTGIPVINGSNIMNTVSGTALQVLRRNAANTGYEFATIAAGGVTQSALDDTATNIRSTLTTGLATKQDALGNNSVTNSMLAGSIAQSKIVNYTGYSINVQALTSSPADGQTIYFGMLPKAPVTAAATSKIYIRKAGTIKVAEIYCYSGTAGTNEAWVMNIRLNNTTDTQIASVALSTNQRVFSNTALSIAVSVGDYIEIKCVNPTWATNPLTCIFGGYIYIE